MSLQYNKIIDDRERKEDCDDDDDYHNYTHIILNNDFYFFFFYCFNHSALHLFYFLTFFFLSIESVEHWKKSIVLCESVIYDNGVPSSVNITIDNNSNG